jgi:hypothetical protein
MTIPYRGTTRNWSQRFFFGTLTTLDSTKFNNLADAIHTASKLCLSSWVGYVGATGYNGGSDLPVFTKTYSDNGSFAHTGERLCPGDCAAMLRFSTTQRTSKNHPIYLYKWFHGVYYDDATAPDTLWSTQATAIDTFGASCVTGFSDGSTNRPISGPYGAVAQGHQVNTWIRHRDFPN